jgi:hypothetical protein
VSEAEHCLGVSKAGVGKVDERGSITTISSLLNQGGRKLTLIAIMECLVVSIMVNVLVFIFYDGVELFAFLVTAFAWASLAGAGMRQIAAVVTADVAPIGTSRARGASPDAGRCLRTPLPRQSPRHPTPQNTTTTPELTHKEEKGNDSNETNSQSPVQRFLFD